MCVLEHACEHTSTHSQTPVPHGFSHMTCMNLAACLSGSVLSPALCCTHKPTHTSAHMLTCGPLDDMASPLKHIWQCCRFYSVLYLLPLVHKCTCTHTHTIVHIYTHQHPIMTWLLLFLHVWSSATCPELSPSFSIHTHDTCV